MAIQVKELTNAAPTLDNSLPAQNDNFNVIPSANSVYDIYTVATAKAAVVKAIRFVNVASGSVKINIYFMRPNSTGQSRRRQLSPVDLSLAAGFLYIDETEITLEAGDRIQAKADTANAIQYTV